MEWLSAPARKSLRARLSHSLNKYSVRVGLGQAVLGAEDKWVSKTNIGLIAYDQRSIKQASQHSIFPLLLHAIKGNTQRKSNKGCVHHGGNFRQHSQGQASGREPLPETQVALLYPWPAV